MKALNPLKPILITVFCLFLSQTLSAQDQWERVETENQSTERHENAFVKAGDKFYLIGGRGLKPVDIYDPSTATWSEGAPTPIEISHFQAVNHNGLIYVMGGLTGGWPSETPLTHIYIYDPKIDRWLVGPEIPPHRQRGAAGVTVYDDKIYLVAGIVNGHTSGWVSWFDEFDPATNTWRELPDAPHRRDHFMTAVAGDKLVAAGGRKSGYQGQGFEATFGETDIYDFKTGQWSTLPSPEGDIPTQRAGTGAISVGDEVLIIGGESGDQTVSHNEVEALNPVTGEWWQLPPLQTGRHGTQPVLSEGRLFIEAGSGDRGGGPELSNLEMYTIPGLAAKEDEPIVAGTLQLSDETHDFGTVRPYATRTLTIELSNSDGNQGIPITYIVLTGSKEMKVDFPYSFPYVLAPGASVSFDVHYSPESTQSAEASLLIKVADRGNRQPEEIIFMGNQD